MSAIFMVMLHKLYSSDLAKILISIPLGKTILFCWMVEVWSLNVYVVYDGREENLCHGFLKMPFLCSEVQNMVIYTVNTLLQLCLQVLKLHSDSLAHITLRMVGITELRLMDCPRLKSVRGNGGTVIILVVDIKLLK